MISILMTFAGFIIAVSFFLYFLSTLDAAKTGVQKIMNCEVQIENSQPVPAGFPEPSINTLTSEQKNHIPLRKCPLCSRILKRDEPLYATHVESAGIRKILIHGCPYCYKDTIS